MTQLHFVTGLWSAWTTLLSVFV